MLYSLKWDDDDGVNESEEEKQTPAHTVELTSKRAFTEIFGDTGRGEIKQLPVYGQQRYKISYMQVLSPIELDQLSYIRLPNRCRC